MFEVPYSCAVPAEAPAVAPVHEIEWLASPALVPYPDALAVMETRVAAIRLADTGECVWLLEHPPLYTAGTSASPKELLQPERLPVFRTGRGGRFTYHGPGQRVAYVMLDLDRRGRDVRAFVRALEDWLLGTLRLLGVKGERSKDGVGIFVDGAKIASIGVRVRRWVTFHGVSLNVDPDLEHFAGIVPCGLSNRVTSLAALGVEADMAKIDGALRSSFEQVFVRDALSANRRSQAL